MSEEEQSDFGAMPYPLPAGIIVERDVRVRMRDEVHLTATVCRPDVDGCYPVIMCVTVYGKDFGPKDYSTLPKIKASGNAVGTMHISEATTWEGPDPGFWVPNGYVVVVANARGYYDSEGEAGIYADHDPQDYADLIEWAGVQPWSSGAVGLNGVSYLAVSQWMCASETKPDHLKAIIPWEGVSDLLRDLMEHGGIPETRFLEGYYSGSLARGAGDDIAKQGHDMLMRAAKVPFPLETIDVPTLVCGSWSDQGLHTRGAFEGFMRIASTQKWLYTHGGNKWEHYYSDEALEWQKSFLDHFLKCDDNGFEQRRRVRLEVRRTKQEFEVRSEDSWPIAGLEFSPRYLDVEHAKLLAEAPAEPQARAGDAEAKVTIDFDMTFDERTEITGPMVLKLWVSAMDTDDLDLFVAVRKIDREGQVVHFQAKDGYRDGEVAFGWLRTSQRHLDPERSWDWHPYLSRDRTEKVQPGEVVPVEIEILASSTVFDDGDTLRLMVSGRDILEFGRFGHDEHVNKGRYAIHAGGECPSHLLIPFHRPSQSQA